MERNEELRGVEKRLDVLRRLCVHDPLVVHGQAQQRSPDDSAAGASLGLALKGCVITSIFPGGPAFLTRQLSESDRVVEVDGQPARDHNVGRLMRGDGLDGSVCTVKVLKSAQSRIGQEGQILEVDVRRAREDVVFEVTRVFDLLADVSAHAKYNGGEELRKLAEETGRQMVKALLERHDREVVLARQHAEVREESMRCVTAIQDSLSSFMGALAQSQDRVFELESKVERYVLLGEERKRLVKALEQQLSMAQVHEEELDERIKDQKAAAAEREASLNTAFKQSTGQLEGKVAELQQHLLNVSRELVEAKGERVAAQQASKGKEEEMGRILEGQNRMMGDIQEQQRAVAEAQERCRVLEGELWEAREKAQEVAARMQEEGDGALKRVEDVLRGEIEMVREEGKRALAAAHRAQEDTHASLESALTRNRELAAQCGWLEELVAAKVKEIAALSEKTGYAPVTQAPPPEVVRRQMEGDLAQLKAALQTRESQILALERNIPPSESADQHVLQAHKAELDRAKAELFDARQEIISLEREIQQESRVLQQQPPPPPKLHSGHSQWAQSDKPDEQRLRPPPPLQQPVFPPSLSSPSRTPGPPRHHPTPGSRHPPLHPRTPTGSPQAALTAHHRQGGHMGAVVPQQVYRPGWGGQQGGGGDKRPVGLGILPGHDTSMYSF